MGDETLAFKLVQLEVIARFRGTIEVLDKGYHTRVNLQLDIIGIGGILLVTTTLILVFKVESLDTSARNYF